MGLVVRIMEDSFSHETVIGRLSPCTGRLGGILFHTKQFFKKKLKKFVKNLTKHPVMLIFISEA